MSKEDRSELHQILASAEKTYKSLLRKHVKHISEERLDRIFDEMTDTFFRHIDDSGTLAYPEIASAASMEDNYRKFVQTDFDKNSFDLSKIYDVKPYRFYPGEFILVQGDTKIGKTAWVQDLCVKIPSMNILYFSLEVHEVLCFRRFIQIAHSMTKEQIFKHYKTKKEDLTGPISHIGVITTPCDLSAMKRMIQHHRPQLVVIDTADSMINYGSRDELGAESRVAFGIKSLANDCNVIVIAVHHISKSAAREGSLDKHSGKGSSSFEQQADKLIGIEVINEGVRRVRCIAARDEANFDILTNIDWSTFRFTQVNDPDNKLITTLTQLNSTFKTGYFNPKFTTRRG